MKVRFRRLFIIPDHHPLPSSSNFSWDPHHNWQRGPNQPISWRPLYATMCQVYSCLTHNVVFCWYSDLILHTHNHIHTQRHTDHSGASRLTHPYKYMFTPPIMCSQQLSLFHWMNNSLTSKIYSPQCLFFPRIIHL